MTVSVLLGITWYAEASIVMPMNIVIARIATVIIVEAAFFASGARNAGTPFEHASTPVMAVQPLANAVSSRKVVRRADPTRLGSGRSSGVMPVVAYRYKPAAINPKIANTKK